MQTSKLWSLLKDEKRQNEPALMTNHFVAKTKMQGFKFSEGGSKIMNLPNAGGSSEASEVMSFELLADMFNAKLLFTEMELNYGPGSKITDFSVQIQGVTVGVSVTRAMKFRGTFTLDDATKLLEKKMMGVIMSTQGVSRSQRWGRQILHVWVEKPYMAELIEQAYEQLSDEIKSNTVVMVTTVSNAQWLFSAY